MGDAADSRPAMRGAGGKPSAARERILAAADRLFYREGIRAVGVEKVIAEAQVTRVTFYRHFPTKDDLIATYLAVRSQREREALAEARAALPGDHREVLRAIVDALIAESRSPGFRGCPYVNAAAEYADPDHPVRHAVAEHRAWFTGQMAELMTELGHPDPGLAAEQIMILRDGAMTAAYLDDRERVAAALVAAGRAIVGYREE
ncbi:TetR/AcrR family transcriptional regulator [Micromonospora chaiyaphumensis]|uniref:Transcriptional regulator, TetR family n=1 Tax=Micromonospora chaiyaphumensis TaxID=307119 RepID=A0A1C4VYH0_9ACTN|nr:TetR/AcrR family transcriptional regulator [Micromonospora chaiyaphumensis]SCE88769.1 transcriptional regulator, TetR family [Micromonospora chaiyaphumensis]